MKLLSAPHRSVRQPQPISKLGEALLAAGVDVLVEKPIATSVSEASRLIELAAQHGRILQTGHLERFNPAVTPPDPS